MRVSGVPFDPGDHPRGPFTPTAIVLHRTYGRWTGDYAVGKHGRDGEPIGFHFLVGKEKGQWVQFHDSATKCSHAKGANRWAIGIELEGTNEDPLTDWQVRALAWIVAAVCDAHGIPRTYAFGGKRREVKGLLPHALVPGSNHTDYVTPGDWQRVRVHLWATPAPQPVQPAVNTTTATPQAPAPSNPPPPPTPAASEQLAEVAAALEFCRHAIVGDGHTVDGPAVVFVQTALNARGAQLLVDGRWGPATRDVVRWFQSLRGLTPDGVVGPATWDALYPR